MRKLRRPAYKALVIAHVAASVAWLGLSLSLLVLGSWALATTDPASRYAAVAAAATLAGTIAVPVGAVALGTGVWLMLGTRWSIAYTWVTVKLVATAITFALTLFLLRPGLAATAAGLDPRHLGAIEADIIAGPVVSSTVYLGATILSYVKPWGRRGARVPAPARAPARSGR